MIYILIILSKYAIATQEFNSKIGCEEAKAAIEQSMTWQAGPISPVVICTPKGRFQ